jgi:hypothetical protein
VQLLRQILQLRSLAHFKGINMKILSIAILIYVLSSSFAYGINVSEVEPMSPVLFIPISVGDITIFIPILSETVPDEAIDDNTMGHVDSDLDGVRDNVEREIALLSPADRQYRGYLYHLAYYTRRLLMAPEVSDPVDPDVMSFDVAHSMLEILKVQACLTSVKGKDDAARVIARHMDSKSRFTAHYKKSAVAEKIPIAIEDYGCIITNLEPIKDLFGGYCFGNCFELNEGWVSDADAGTVGYNAAKSIGMGVDVKLLVTAINKSDSDGNITVKLNAVRGLDHGSYELAPGQEKQIIVSHSYNRTENKGFLRYDVTRVSGFLNKFKITYEPYFE